MGAFDQKIEELEQRLAAYISAERILLQGGQSVSIGNRSLTRADLDTIAKQIVRLNGELMQLKRGNTIAMQRVVPRDI